MWIGAVVALDAILEAAGLAPQQSFRTLFGGFPRLARFHLRRPGGAMGNPDHLGTFCAALLPVAIALHNVPATLLLVLATLLTYCRGAWLAVGWPLLSLGGAYLYSQKYKILADASIQARLRYWRHAWDLIKEHPWIGHGLGTFEVHVAPLHRESSRLTHAHNEYLELWHDLGVFAMLLFPAIGGLAAWQLWHKGAAGMAIGLIVLLTDALWSPGLRSLPVQLLFWLFVGCASTAADPLPFAWDAWRIGLAALLLALPNVGICLFMADVHFKSGMMAWRDGQLDKAITAFSSSYLAAPGKHALYALGMASAAAGRNEDAIFFYEKVLHYDPYFAQTHVMLGKLLFLAGKEEEGMLHFQEQEEIDDLMMVAPEERDAILNLM